jgi:hypothetical protein
VQSSTEGAEPSPEEERAQQLESALAPSTERLDASVDRRVGGTLAASVASLVQTNRELTLTTVPTGCAMRWNHERSH